KVQRNSSDAINDFRDQTNSEKKELLTNHTNQKKQLVQDANISRNRANSLHQVEMERLREAAKQNENTLRNNFENSYESLKATKNAENENQRGTFEALTQKIQDRNTESLSRLNDNNKEEKRELEKNFANDRIQLERRTNSIINQGHASKVENTKKSLIRQHENQLANVREAVEENTKNNAILNERLATDQANVLKNTEVKHNMDLEAKDAEMRNLRKVEIGGLKERFESANELQSKRYRNLELQSEGQQVKARKTLTSRLDNQRMEFSRTLNQINQSNQEAMSDARKEMAEEQSNFIENTKKMTHNEIAELKEDFSEQMTKREASLTSQLQMAKKQNINLAQKYQNKLDTVNKKAAKEMETLKQFENQRRLEDRRAAQRQLDLQQRDFEKNMNSLRREYDRRLNDTKAHNDVHVAKLTERYESQISRERAEFNAERQRMMSSMNANYNRLVDKTKMEKDNLINQYEVKIEKLRTANRQANEIKTTRNA
ncbi:MAG: hypothetical protein NXH75_14115, partial [Halobacteriovoraceae bacterium]|nr:hypothetical protein [Halobacteriovoraceae bacterium]